MQGSYEPNKEQAAAQIKAALSTWAWQAGLGEIASHTESTPSGRVQVLNAVAVQSPSKICS